MPRAASPHGDNLAASHNASASHIYRHYTNILSGRRWGSTDKLIEINTLLSEERRVPTDKLNSRGQQKSGKAVVALFRIYQRIMGEPRKICGECQVTKKKREQEKKLNKKQEKIEREKTDRRKRRDAESSEAMRRTPRGSEIRKEKKEKRRREQRRMRRAPRGSKNSEEEKREKEK